MKLLRSAIQNSHSETIVFSNLHCLLSIYFNLSDCVCLPFMCLLFILFLSLFVSQMVLLYLRELSDRIKPSRNPETVHCNFVPKQQLFKKTHRKGQVITSNWERYVVCFYDRTEVLTEPK